MSETPTRPQTRDRQRKIASHPRRAGKSSLARITYLSDTHVGCSCGWVFDHAREKVREDAIDRHLNKKHGGRGIRL